MATSKGALQRNEERLVELVAGWTDVQRTAVTPWPERNDLVRTGFGGELSQPGRIVQFSPECLRSPGRWGLKEVWRNAGHIIGQYGDRRYLLLWDIDAPAGWFARALSHAECREVKRLLPTAPGVQFPDDPGCTANIVYDYFCRDDGAGWNPLTVSEMGIELYLAQPTTKEIPTWVFLDYRYLHTDANVWAMPEGRAFLIRQPPGLPYRLFWLARSHDGAYARQLTAVEADLLDRVLLNDATSGN